MVGFRATFLILIFSLPVTAQSRTSTDTTELVTIGRIILAGNNVTQRRIIERELELIPGDTIRRFMLNQILKQEQKKIYNLRLFNLVSVEPLELEPRVIDLLIEVEERWYTYPVPIFELSDRNFNEWWENYNRDLSRVNYGLRLFQYNFRGRNETLRFTARFGFSRRFDLYYKIPNLTLNQKHGLLFEAVYGEPFNVAYRTDDHILQFLSDQKPLRSINSFATTYTFRKSFYKTHSIRAGISQIAAADTILKLNPAYLVNGFNPQVFSALSYKFIAEHRDVIAYPLKGYLITAAISKVGLTPGEPTKYVNINGSFAWHREVGDELYFSLYSFFSANTNSRQPYTMISGVGYDRQYIRGYERYVIEGPFFSMNKTTIKRRVFNREYSVEGLKINQFRYLPVAVYLKAFADFGYVNNYPLNESRNLNTRLTNSPLAGAGFGIDFVTYYDSVLRLEYTFTSQATSGLFLNIKKEF
ncbi:MAG: POTRA domain-containing protein [Cyclobacteriaceae bacterium]